jgi:hypothetical protein
VRTALQFSFGRSCLAHPTSTGACIYNAAALRRHRNPSPPPPAAHPSRHSHPSMKDHASHPMMRTFESRIARQISFRYSWGPTGITRADIIKEVVCRALHPGGEKLEGNGTVWLGFAVGKESCRWSLKGSRQRASWAGAAEGLPNRRCEHEAAPGHSPIRFALLQPRARQRTPHTLPRPPPVLAPCNSSGGRRPAAAAPRAPCPRPAPSRRCY